MGPFLMWKSGGPSSTFIYHDSDKGNVKMISGSPATKVQCTIEQYFDVSKLDDGVKEFIISPRYTGRMVFNVENDGRSTDELVH